MEKNVNSLHVGANVNYTQSELSFNFQNKLIIVTGSAHGIGRAICKAFVLAGGTVIAIDVLEDQLQLTKDEIESFIYDKALSGRIETILCDVTNEVAIQKLIDHTISTYERIDVLINVAGGVAGQVHQPIENVTEEEWNKVVDINLKSVFLMTRAVVPFMKKQNSGRIVNISSGAGRSSSLTGIQAYTSAKAGQIGLTRQMARELGKYGITVNNIAPGFVLSNPSTQKQWELMTPQEQASLVDSISVKRLGKSEDIAYPVLFFASDFAAYISGQVISADGGMQLF